MAQPATRRPPETRCAPTPHAAARTGSPRVSHALNLADTLGAHNVSHALNDLVASGRYDRVYLGSYFCDRYFCAVPLGVFARTLARCADLDLPVTLVVPIPSENALDATLSRLDLLLDGHGEAIDEVTCNDLGTLSWCSENLDRRLNVGRLFNRDAREPRDPGFVAQTIRPALLTRGHAAAFPKCRVDGYEFDPITPATDLSDAPADVVCALHADWCYASTGKICEVASIGTPAEHKFRPNEPCTCTCLHCVLEHRPREAGAPAYFKHGRTVYYRQPAARCVGIDAYRLVHPALLTEGCERP